MSIINFLELCRKGLDKEYYATLKIPESDIDKAAGTTKRMHNYCCSNGLGHIPDINRIWKITKNNYLWKVKLCVQVQINQ